MKPYILIIVYDSLTTANKNETCIRRLSNNSELNAPEPLGSIEKAFPRCYKHNAVSSRFKTSHNTVYSLHKTTNNLELCPKNTQRPFKIKKNKTVPFGVTENIEESFNATQKNNSKGTFKLTQRTP